MSWMYAVKRVTDWQREGNSERRRKYGVEVLTTVNLVEVGELREGLRVAEGHEDDAVVDEGGEGVGDGDLLATARGRSRHERARELAREGALGPERASGVPEGLKSMSASRKSY